jgi:hypothetical protein
VVPNARLAFDQSVPGSIPLRATTRVPRAAIVLLWILLTLCPGFAAAQPPLATGPASSQDDRVRLRLDPDEPDAVVREFDRLLRRQPDVMSPAVVRREIGRWQAVSAASPRSRAASEHVARLQETLADQTGELADRRASADAWIRAGDMALDHGDVRHTAQISHALVAIRDMARLDEFFSRCLAVARRGAPTAAYLPLLDYADGLAAFGRREARTYFRQAYELHVNEAGLNRYVGYLLDQRDPTAALMTIESLSDDERRPNVVILSLWRRALQQAGRDTKPADTALAEMERRSRGAQGGVFVGPSGRR